MGVKMSDMIKVNAVNENAVKIEIGIRKYTNIMERLHNCDVSQDREFQKAYNGFYRVRQKPQEWYQIYYDYMQRHKSDNINFDNVLTYLYKKLDRLESSFSSKLLATINPNMPVWDANVLSQLSIKAPSYSQSNRLNATIETYSVLQKWYAVYLKTPNAQEVTTRFDELFPNTQITDLKKIDLILWSMGRKNVHN
jgi:hypothetical protein